jgi:hypothetical protein
MSTKAEETSIQALSPELTGGAALVAAAGVVDVVGLSSAARRSEAAPETESITVIKKIDRPILAGLIALFPFPKLEDTPSTDARLVRDDFPGRPKLACFICYSRNRQVIKEQAHRPAARQLCYLFRESLNRECVASSMPESSPDIEECVIRLYRDNS